MSFTGISGLTRREIEQYMTSLTQSLTVNGVALTLSEEKVNALLGGSMRASAFADLPPWVINLIADPQATLDPVAYGFLPATCKRDCSVYIVNDDDVPSPRKAERRLMLLHVNREQQGPITYITISIDPFMQPNATFDALAIQAIERLAGEAHRTTRTTSYPAIPLPPSFAPLPPFGPMSGPDGILVPPPLLPPLMMPVMPNVPLLDDRASRVVRLNPPPICVSWECEISVDTPSGNAYESMPGKPFAIEVSQRVKEVRLRHRIPSLGQSDETTISFTNPLADIQQQDIQQQMEKFATEVHGTFVPPPSRVKRPFEPYELLPHWSNDKKAFEGGSQKMQVTFYEGKTLALLNLPPPIGSIAIRLPMVCQEKRHALYLHQPSSQVKPLIVHAERKKDRLVRTVIPYGLSSDRTSSELPASLTARINDWLAEHAALHGPSSTADPLGIVVGPREIVRRQARRSVVGIDAREY